MLPGFTGLIFVAYAFKFALLSHLNQGCIPSLFSLTASLVAILFYFKFNEKLNGAQIIGILAMIPTVLLLSFDEKKEETEEVGSSASLSVEEM